MDKFQRAIFDYITKNNLNQKAVAEKLGVSEPTLSRWLSGQAYIPKRRLELIQKLTGVDFSIEKCPLEDNCPIFDNEVDYLTAELFKTISKIKKRKTRLKALQYLTKLIDND